MASFTSIARPKTKLAKGRVCAVFGPRGVGKSTLLRTVTAETRTALIIPGAQLEKDITAAQDRGAEIVFIDGMPTCEEDVQWLYDLTFLGPKFGQLMRCERNAIRDDEFLRRLPAINERARRLGLDMPVIHLDDPVQGLTQLLIRAEVRG